MNKKWKRNKNILLQLRIVRILVQQSLVQVTANAIHPFQIIELAEENEPIRLIAEH